MTSAHSAPARSCFQSAHKGRRPSAWKGILRKGVFHAKDVVYHFNRLPGFGDRPFEMGKHVAVIGAGRRHGGYRPLADSL